MQSRRASLCSPSRSFPAIPKNDQGKMTQYIEIHYKYAYLDKALRIDRYVFIAVYVGYRGLRVKPLT